MKTLIPGTHLPQGDTITITVGHIVDRSVDILSDDLDINYAYIPAVRKGWGLGKNMIIGPVEGTQCNACIEGLEKEREEMESICSEMATLALKLRDLNESVINSEIYKKYVEEHNIRTAKKGDTHTGLQAI